MKRDPYEVLGLHPGATQQEIEEAYQKLTQVYDANLQSNPSMRQFVNEKRQELEEAHRALLSGESGDFRQAGSSSGSYDARSNAYSGPFGGSANNANASGNGNPYGGGQSPFGNNFGYNRGQQSPGYCCATPGCADCCCAWCVADSLCDCLSGGCC